MSVVNKIIYLLKKNDISARRLTIDLNLSNSSISEWKKGKAKPSIDAVIKIAKYFGVTTDYLLMEDDISGDGMAPFDSEGSKEKAEDPYLSMQAVGEEEKGNDTGNNTANNTWLLTEPLEINRDKPAELTKEDRELLNYYHRLDEKDRQYIWCKIVVLEREYAE